MSCSCGSSPCCCSYSTSGIDCPCADPGLETSGDHLAIYDSQFCPKRLSMVSGFLWISPTGKVSSSVTPKVPLEYLEVEEGDTFDGIVLARGSNGHFYRLKPATGVDGVLKANGAGAFTIEDVSSSFTVPDPLTLNELNATTVNVEDLNTSGTVTLTNLPTDTVVSFVGLNGSSQLVKGAVQTVSIATYFESNSLTSVSRPNYDYPGTATSNVKLGNEITDVDGIAHVQSDEIVKLDQAGSYEITWQGTFEGYNPAGTAGGTVFYPGLNLRVNGVSVDYGSTVYQDRRIGGVVTGSYVLVTANVGDELSLARNGNVRTSVGENGLGLSGVKMTLRKFK